MTMQRYCHSLTSAQADRLQDDSCHDVGEGRERDHQAEQAAQGATDLSSKGGADQLVEHLKGIQAKLKATFWWRKLRRMIWTLSSFSHLIVFSEIRGHHIHLDSDFSPLYLVTCLLVVIIRISFFTP